MAALLAELARAWPAERQALEAVLPWLLPAAPLLAHFYSYLPPRRWYWLTLLPPPLLAGLGYGWPDWDWPQAWRKPFRLHWLGRVSGLGKKHQFSSDHD